MGERDGVLLAQIVLRNRAVLRALMALVAGVVFGSQALALTVSPLVIDLATVGRDSRTEIIAVNDGTTPLPVEALVYRLELEEDGKQVLSADEDDLLVFPPQALIQPGQRQLFRVQWVGEPALDAGRSYGVSINQIPVDVAPDSKGLHLQFVLNFIVITNVASTGATGPELALLESKAVTNKDGVSGLEFLVGNSGATHGYVSRHVLTLSGNGWSRTINAESLGKAGLGLVQPGKRRRLFVPIENLPGSLSGLKGEFVPAAER